jgi:predicted DNA binding CopG/RHH family protein
MSAARHRVDPFDDMSDADFDAHVADLFAARPSGVAVSFRVAPELLGRVKRQAARAGVPYQTFMNGILEAACPGWSAARLGRNGPRAGRRHTSEAITEQEGSILRDESWQWSNAGRKPR